MTKSEALYNFWSGFGLTAFERNAVPTKGEDGAPGFPYLTYDVEAGGFGSVMPLTASLWYRSSSWREAEEKGEKIFGYIGRGGVFLRFDGGVLWLKRGDSFAKRSGDGSDDMVKRMDLNISVEFWTEE